MAPPSESWNTMSYSEFSRAYVALCCNCFAITCSYALKFCFSKCLITFICLSMTKNKTREIEIGLFRMERINIEHNLLVTRKDRAIEAFSTPLRLILCCITPTWSPSSRLKNTIFNAFGTWRRTWLTVCWVAWIIFLENSSTLSWIIDLYCSGLIKFLSLQTIYKYFQIVVPNELTCCLNMIGQSKK